MQKISRLLVNWAPALLWMAVIFSASSDSGSFKHSSRIIEPIVRWLFPQVTDAALDWIILIVRKCAHLTEFAILALLFLRALRRQVADTSKRWNWRLATFAMLLVVLYASSDEFHQLFVPTRQASVIDVLIDSTGAALGLMAAWLISKRRRLRQES